MSHTGNGDTAEDRAIQDRIAREEREGRSLCDLPDHRQHHYRACYDTLGTYIELFYSDQKMSSVQQRVTIQEVQMALLEARQRLMELME